MGIFAMLDEECRFPKGTDQSFVEKMHTALGKEEYYDKPRLKGMFLVSFLVCFAHLPIVATELFGIGKLPQCYFPTFISRPNRF